MRWQGILAVATVLLTACGQPAQGRTATATRTESSPSPQSETSSGTGTAPPAHCPATQSVGGVTASSNLVVVWLKGGQCFVVRDITDILHPRIIAASTDFRSPQFVSATELSYQNGQLFRMQLPGLQRVPLRGGNPYAWGPDGASLAYMGGTPEAGVQQLHIVSGGQDRIADPSVPALRGGIGCESRSGCGETWDVRMLYSPNGAYISLNYVPGIGVFRIWTADGKVLKSLDSGSATMSVWSGDALYWRDDKGVQKWQAGQQSLLLPGVAWVRPRASPAGGLIVYGTRDAGGVAHVLLLDTTSGKARELKSSRSEPAFLNAHLIWYKEERPCRSGDGWPCGTESTVASGKTFIYDLQDNTETESVIDYVFDVWPHPA